MKKIHLLLSVLLCAVLTAKAQTNTISWGYCNASSVTNIFGEATTAKGAIYIPAEIAKIYEGAKVTGVRVGFGNNATNVKIFVTEDLNGSPIIEESTTDCVRGMKNISFTTGSYTITEKGFYVGYSCTSATADSPIGISDLYDENGCWADLGDGWKNYSADPAYKSSALCIFARIKGDNLPKDFALLDVNSLAQKKDTPFTISGTLMSRSPKLGRVFRIAYSIDGGEETIAEVNKQIGTGVSKSFEIEHPGLSESGNHTVVCRLLTVDGVEDPYEANNTASGTIGIVGRFPFYRMVVEKGTGTWCQYCPRGIWGFEKMMEKYPDNFVGIAVHKNEDTYGRYGLECSSYNALTFSSYPSAYVNRNPRMNVSPIPAVLEAAYQATCGDLRLGEVNVKSELVNSNTINATATTTFVSDINNADYSISFVLTEDNVSGYYQSNGCKGMPYDEVGPFSTEGSAVAVDMQHVAREIFGFRGLENSIPTTVKAEEPVTFTKTLTIPASVRDVKNLNVIAMLFNNRTGLIENAAQARVGEASVETAIADIDDSLVPEIGITGGKVVCTGFDGDIRVYSVDGKQVANQNLGRGIYIVKASNGKQTFVKRIAL